MFIVNREWLYIHIPKTSGTNLKHLFLHSDNHIFENVYIKFKAYDYWCSNITKNKNFEFLNEYYSLNEHIPLNVYEKVFDCSKLKIFTIVRNPYSWAVSSYHYIMKNFPFELFPEVKKDISFKEFFYHKYFSDIQYSFPINLSANQCDFLINSNGEIGCDKIYKMEDELQQLGQDFGLKNILTTKSNVGDYDRDYSKYYDDEMIEKVREIYKKDFETFNYSKDPFWL